MRACRTCGITGALDLFVPNKASRFGRKNLCRRCWNAQERLRKQLVRSVLGKERLATINREPANRWARLKWRAKARGIPLEITRDEWAVVVADPCHYCGGALSPTGCGLDRKDPAGGYTLANVVPCCTGCNNRKKLLPYEQYVSV
jgi:hypothetical protein